MDRIFSNFNRVACISLSVAMLLNFPSKVLAQQGNLEKPIECSNIHDTVNQAEGAARFARTLCADIVALDQMMVYNRFGSFNPYGMIYALRRDVVSTATPVKALTADQCDMGLGIESHGTDLAPGKVRLRDCKRPRPLTLRANVGDILHIRLGNALRAEVPGFSETFCKTRADEPGMPYGAELHGLRAAVSEEIVSGQLDHGEASCRPANGSPRPSADGNWPMTRGANLAIQGLTSFGLRDGQMIEAPDACKGLAAIKPGAAIDCFYMIEREGPFFMASTGAPSGGQGDGGSLTHGLFGAVMAEPSASRWYRSQVTQGAFRAVWRAAENAVRHAIRAADIDDPSRYEVVERDPISGRPLPLLNMLARVDRADEALRDEDPNAYFAKGVFEVVHSDLNAIVYREDREAGRPLAFREFSVFFHDELKTFYPRNFEELGAFGAGQLSGVRDGFAINYGASGMGDMLLANRKGIGPAANCQECLYEEFFLTSWANGDPALLEHYSDDPSNVHHSYLNDPVVFRNFHAGPKETHIFHLHAHQWFAGNDGNRGAYLDSQTVAPQQGFSYDIYGGGMEVYHRGTQGEQGWYETLGSGNRNRTVGDSIFHCHLYPHFAQGMWELWRVHDVLEDGSRKLPDGQWEPVLSLAEMGEKIKARKRPGSVDQATGRWIEPSAGLSPQNVGTPVPAIVPLPGQAWPVLPSYPMDVAKLDEEGRVSADPVSEITTFAGYPFYIAGQPGHRPPQAPMDIARALDGDMVTGDYLDGGMPRHVVTDDSTRALPFTVPQSVADRLAADPGTSNLASALADPALRQREALQSQILATALSLGDMTMKLKALTIDLLEYDGEPIERSAMAFHHNGVLPDGTALSVLAPDGSSSLFEPSDGGYPTQGGAKRFTVNGAPAKPGAPFADPCGAPSAFGQITRVDADNYSFVSGGASFPILTVSAGQPLVGGADAGDAEVSNWVEHERTDRFPNGPPTLYYMDGATARVIERGAHVFESDPFLKGLKSVEFTPDPAVIGYRRYEGSAVQVDMITNRAGWHDPQARINVLTHPADGYPGSDSYKKGGGRISPKVTASEEPFFFRALSGECIEFRHTNELPKELELDDFQVKTPTDTIGQHIHLVKFDVTASDGSSNGFNYEDGTFAPGEIAARICAAKNTASIADVSFSRSPGELLMREYSGDKGDLCAKDPKTGLWKVSEAYDHKIWTLPLSGYRELFQTTTQRWFADPILSDTRAPDDGSGIGKADRTLRTVFSHDHFGPSSIQQHGFYTALVIEPQIAQICDPGKVSCTAPRVDRDLVTAGPQDVGARKVIVDLLPVDTDVLTYREFAVSIADFALLYDPRNNVPVEAVEKALQGGDTMAMKGMLTLACEARHGARAAALEASGAPSVQVDARLQDMSDICDSALAKDGTGWFGAMGDLPPAWLAAGRPGDPAHQAGLAPALLDQVTVNYHGTDYSAPDFLQLYMTDYRAKAAGHAPGPEALLASPVSPPARPESISVDHHDPYLVNYRGEPFPLRLGEDSRAGSSCALTPRVEDWVTPLLNGVTDRCEISRQKTGEPGDPANVMLSALHQDPATPIFQALDNEPLQFRLIQGAQEVQHTFTVEGMTLPRNIDQMFPSATSEREPITPRETLVRTCETNEGAASSVRMARAGRPDEYRQWAAYGANHWPAGSSQRQFWADIEAQLAQCFNADGRIAAQEIGISEHFEFRAAFLYDNNFSGLGEEVSRNRFAPGRITSVQTLLDLLRERREQLVLRTRVSDTPYHFGSQDALWNGAWGLIRVAADNRNYLAYVTLLEQVDRFIAEAEPLVRDNPDAPPPPALLRDSTRLLLAPLDEAVKRLPELSTDPQLRALPRNLGTLDAAPDQDTAATPEPLIVPLERFQDEAQRTLRALPELRQDRALKRLQLPVPERSPILRPELNQLELFFRGKTEVPDYQPVAECPRNAPNVYTAIVAIESETVFPGQAGTNYSNSLNDPDGLFFALVDPRVLINPDMPQSVSDLDLELRTNWEAIPLSRVIDAVRRFYDKPEPLVINVNAGDCVFVTLLNALRYQDGRIPGLADGTGDARMPGITSLNVERPWEAASEEENTPHEMNADSDRSTDVVPSARLAVTLPLPILTRQSSYGRPFGNNAIWALSGIPADQRDPTLSIRDRTDRLKRPRIAEIEQFQFYAGLAYADYSYTLPTPLVASLSETLAPQTADFLGDLGRGITIPEGIAALPLLAPSGSAPTLLGNQLLQLRDQRDGAISRLRTTLEGVPQQPTPEVAPPIRVPAIDGQLRDIGRLPQGTLRQLEGRVPQMSGEARVVLPGDTLLRDSLGQLNRIPNLRPADLDRRLADIIDGFEIDRERLVPGPDSLGIIKRQLVTHFIPYAYGALPLKSFGDVIGHPTHGLIGAITVVPQNASIGDVRGRKIRFEACENRLVAPGTSIAPQLRLYDLGELQARRWLELERLPNRTIRLLCENYVIVPPAGARSAWPPMWHATLRARGPDGAGSHPIRQFTLFWQDGLNQRDRDTADIWALGGSNERLVKDCAICDDSYDWGDKGVSYLSEPFHVRLRDTNLGPVESHYNLNEKDFGTAFWKLKPTEIPTATKAPMPVLRAVAGEEVVVHVVHPGGRARQRAFATIAQDYSDLFPGFGFPRAALLAPGKAITASLTKVVEPGCYLWFDGPLHLRAGGVWGLLDVLTPAQARDPKATSCSARR